MHHSVITEPRPDDLIGGPIAVMEPCESLCTPSLVELDQIERPLTSWRGRISLLDVVYFLYDGRCDGGSARHPTSHVRLATQGTSGREGVDVGGQVPPGGVTSLGGFQLPAGRRRVGAIDGSQCIFAFVFLIDVTSGGRQIA